MRLRHTLTLAAAGAAVALSSLGGQASGEAQTGSVNACQLLTSVVQHDVVLQHHLTLHHFIQNGPGWRCEFTSKPAKGTVTSGWALLLYFSNGPSVSAAQANVHELLRESKAAGKKVVILRGTGATEAFAVERTSPHATSTTATWRRGRCWGWLTFSGPGLRGDVEDATGVLKALIVRLPSHSPPTALGRRLGERGAPGRASADSVRAVSWPVSCWTEGRLYRHMSYK